jgi:penicillin amidase
VVDWVEEVMEGARRALPPVEGEVRLAPLEEPVEVIRDRWGVPHIYAGSLRDLFVAQGYVTASDRLFQIDFLTRLATGRLSGLFSEMTLSTDRFFRTVGLHRAARRIVEGYDEQSREMVDALVEGIRAYIEKMPESPMEYQVLELEPELPAGEEAVMAGAAVAAFMAWILSTNWDAELLRVELAERLGWEGMLALFPDLTPEPAIVTPGKDAGAGGRRSALDILRTAPLTPKGQGSNNWVVAGSRSATGKPLLANDPHLAVQTPSIWYECHLSAPGFEVSGVTLCVAPGVIIGHTAHHAWGFTNVGGDVQDLYLERLSEDRRSALYNGEWEPVTVHREEIPVRGNAEPEVLEVVETRHGPVLDSYMVGIANPLVVEGGVKETYALRWVGHEAAIHPSSLYRMAVARSFEEFREASRDWHCPGQNMVYADVDGNIGYQCTGRHPIRRKGDGTVPVPGWTDEYEWEGYIPFDELPWSLNPEAGFLGTANQKIHDDGYPHLIGRDFLPPYRARRIAQLITATEKHSQESFARMHMDTVSLVARMIVPHLLDMEPADDRQKEALSHLSDWDGDLAADSVPACIYQVWSKHIAREVLLPKLGPELFTHYYGRRQWTNAFQTEVLPTMLEYPSAMWFGADGVAARDEVLRRALSAALEELTSTLGEDMAAWRWGALHRVRFAHPLALIPDLADPLTAGVVETGGDEQTLLQGMFEPEIGYDAVVIPSWRHIIDLSDIDASVGIHTTGQSGNPASPHWNDMVEPWSTGRYHPLPFSRQAVERQAASALRLVP